MPSYNAPMHRIVKPATAPAAGEDWQLKATNGAGWLIRSLTFVFFASAAVANRSVVLSASDGERTYFMTAAGGVMQANDLGTYYAFAGSVRGVATTDIIALDWPTDGLWLPQGCSLESATSGLDVADEYTDIIASVVEYPSGPVRELWPLGPGTLFDPSSLEG